MMSSPFNAQRQTGVAVVEFVIAMPLLLFLMLATAELGRAFYQYTALEKAVEGGARYLADHARDATGTLAITDEYRTAVRNLVMYGDVQGDTGTLVTPGLTAANINVEEVSGLGGHFRVTVSYPYQPIFPDFPVLGWISQQVTIDSPLRVQVTMRAI